MIQKIKSVKKRLKISLDNNQNNEKIINNSDKIINPY